MADLLKPMTIRQAQGFADDIEGIHLYWAGAVVQLPARNFGGDILGLAALGEDSVLHVIADPAVLDAPADHTERRPQLPRPIRRMVQDGTDPPEETLCVLASFPASLWLGVRWILLEEEGGLDRAAALARLEPVTVGRIITELGGPVKAKNISVEGNLLVLHRAGLVDVRRPVRRDTRNLLAEALSCSPQGVANALSVVRRALDVRSRRAA